MLLSHLAIVRLHFRRMTWRLHAAFLEKMAASGALPADMGALLHASKQRAQMKKDLSSKLRRTKKPEQKPATPALSLPLLSPKKASASPVVEKMQARSALRQQKISDSMAEQQRQMNLLRKQNNLLESINR